MTPRAQLNRAILLILKHYPADDEWGRWARKYTAGSIDNVDELAVAARSIPKIDSIEDITKLPEDQRKEAFAKDEACRAAWYLWRMANPADEDGPVFCEMWVKEKTRAIHSYMGEWPQV